ncbi:MAG: hypothetical protein H6837_21315 [Planctomycetes bacterium]|nr:hypothetical protein [Planctomycetota bacterium]
MEEAPRRPRLLHALVALLAAPLTSQSDTGIASAPAGTWYCAGGCAARTGHTRTAPALTEPPTAWEFTLPEGSTFEGEPRVWRDVVLLCEKREGQRVLHLLDLEDGKPFCRPVPFATELPLATAIWGDIIVVRSGPQALRVLRLSRPVVEPVQHFNFSDPVSGHVLHGDELYVAAGKLFRMRPTQPKPLWAAGDGLVGAVSLSGERVLTFRRSNGDTNLRGFLRADGKARGNTELGAFEPDPAQELPMAVGGNRTFVGNGARLFEIQTLNVRAYRCAWLPLNHRSWWIGLEGRQGVLFRQIPGLLDTDTIVLADRKSHPELLSIKFAPSGASDAVYFGNLGFDIRTGNVLWRSKLDTVQRPIPVTGGVLLSPAENRVVVLRHRSGGDWRSRLAHKPASSPLPSTGKHSGAVMITDAGVQKRTTVTVSGSDRDSAKFSFGSGSSKRDLPGKAVTMLLDGKQKPIYWGGTPQAVAQGLTAWIEAQVDTEFIRLAKKSLATNDVPTIQRYMAEITQRGATRSDISEFKRNLKRIETLKHRVRPNKVEELHKAEANLYSNSVKRNWDVYERLVDQQPFAHALASTAVILQRDPSLLDRVLPKLRRFDATQEPVDRVALAGALLDGAPGRVAEVWKLIEPHLGKLSRSDKVQVARWFLDREPKHKGAAALVQELNPIRVPGADKIPAAEWLELLEAAANLEFGVVRIPENKNDFVPSPELRELAKQMARWRKDLVAIQSNRVLIITPMVNPGRIARCLAMSELLCDTLEKMFAFSTRKRSRALRMKILLCASQKEYIQLSASRGVGAHVVWTSGHYDPQERISRMFLPSGEGAFESVLDVLAHELTHYWVDVQCPLFDDYNIVRVAQCPGYWIVEGFASMLEEFTFDLGAREVRATRPGSHSLDIVANASKRQLIDWEALLTLSQAGMHRHLDPRPGSCGVVRTSWSLGKSSLASQMNMFYSQASAICHYLYSADGGKHRRQLLEYLGAFYTGKLDQLDLAKTLGTTPDELGKRVVAFAKRASGR